MTHKIATFEKVMLLLLWKNSQIIFHSRRGFHGSLANFKINWQILYLLKNPLRTYFSICYRSDDFFHCSSKLMFLAIVPTALALLLFLSLSWIRNWTIKDKCGNSKGKQWVAIQVNLLFDVGILKYLYD